MRLLHHQMSVALLEEVFGLRLSGVDVRLLLASEDVLGMRQARLRVNGPRRDDPACVVAPGAA